MRRTRGYRSCLAFSLSYCKSRERWNVAHRMIVEVVVLSWERIFWRVILYTHEHEHARMYGTVSTCNAMHCTACHSHSDIIMLFRKGFELLWGGAAVDSFMLLIGWMCVGSMRKWFLENKERSLQHVVILTSWYHIMVLMVLSALQLWLFCSVLCQSIDQVRVRVAINEQNISIWMKGLWTFGAVMSCQWFLEKEVCAFVGARCEACVYILLLQYITAIDYSKQWSSVGVVDGL